jgi:hypothetical protein
MTAYIVVNATITDQAIIGMRLKSSKGFLALVDGFA